jgi:hypothetical protein
VCSGGPWPHPVDTEGAPVGAVAVPADEVPLATEVHQPVRLDLPALVCAVVGAVVEAETVLVPAAPAMTVSTSGATIGPPCLGVTVEVRRRSIR